MFKTTGHIYAQFRQYYPIPEMEKYKVILMLREPRDAITSLYFCRAYSHYIPQKRKVELELLTIKKTQKTIDDFVTEGLWFRPNYDRHTENILNKKNVLLLKYEDMVADFTECLSEMFKHLQVQPSNELIKNLRDSAIFEVKEKNIYSNKRQVQPGDHRRKLDIKTIKQLNLEFKEVLNISGWSRYRLQEEYELFTLTLERLREKLEKFKFLL